ncbi:MAG: DUF481 domain-containing protein [Acidobacteria bacterium]|nr:DUF481 domain-containing protein [Acidobacteriota bacterium]
MTTRSTLLALLCLICSALAIPARAQTAEPSPTQPQLLRVFVDCYECDTDALRQNVQFVDYVRDRAVADLHLLVTTQSTGGGGTAWTAKFIGLGRFDKVDRTLTFNTAQTATSDERRKEFTRIFKLGVASYAVDSSAGAQLDVQWVKPTEAKAALPAKDPWNYWVFRTNLSGNRDGEESANFSSYRMSFSANRTTEAWKINLSTSGSYNKSVFDLGEEDGGKIESTSDSWSVNSLVVKSLGPRWSIGGRASVSHSSFSNSDRVFTVAPGLEFSFFPYSESSRRSLTTLYTIGASHYDYKDATIFDKLKETVPDHSLATQVSLRQPWGSMYASVTVSQHLNEPARHRVSTYASADVRLFKGFSFNLYGGYDRIRDQISLRKGGATPEEVLLRRRQLATGHSYNLGFGISYSFGSIFNSVVNPRFGGGGGHFIFF